MEILVKLLMESGPPQEELQYVLSVTGRRRRDTLVLTLTALYTLRETLFSYKVIDAQDAVNGLMQILNTWTGKSPMCQFEPLSKRLTHGAVWECVIGTVRFELHAPWEDTNIDYGVVWEGERGYEIRQDGITPTEVEE